MKSSDQITSVDLSQKASKDHYAGAIHQISLCSLHEIFEADRRRVIKTINLEVSTGQLILLSVFRLMGCLLQLLQKEKSIMGYNLSAVDPAATLSRLGASVSKNPYGLVATSSKGIRS